MQTSVTVGVQGLLAHSVICFIQNTEIYTNISCLFQNYVLTLLNTTYEKVGFKTSADDDHPTKLIRNTVLTWACNFNSILCLESASEFFKQWKDNPNNNV